MASNNQNSRVARNRDNQPPKGHHPIRRVIGILLAVFIALLVLGGGLFTYYAMSAPKVTTAKLSSQAASIIYDSQGTEIKTLGLENRTSVTESQIPQQLKDAVVSIEDRRFYTNIGIDPVRIVGALFANVRGSSGLQGGSTLTQQLIKLSVFSTKASDQTIKRKAQEAWLALKVDRTYSKEQILEFYMNKVYLSNGVYGMGTAAKYYYGKSLNQLSLPQLALIAGMPQAPSSYDPYVNPSAAKERRDTVLQAMVTNKKISASQAQQAEATPITTGLKKQTTNSTNTNDPTIDAYVSQVISEVKKKTGLNPYTAGLKIYTNLNLKLQKRLYDIVNTNNYVSFPDNTMQTGVTMTNVNNGKVMAMIGGRKSNVQLGLNRAVQTTRSNGSTMKPMLDYGPAIEYLNYSTYHQMNDSAYTYPGTNVQLNDWDFKYLGKISMRTALAQSRNIPAVKTLNKVGISRATQFVNGLGISFDKTLTLSNAIGADVSSLQEAAAYSAFANGGTYYQPYVIHKVTKPDGTSINYNASGKRAMKKSTAYMITDMLKDVIKTGTGTQAAISGLYQAGKTGTTNYSDDELSNNSNINSNESKDSWFTGYTRNYAISVWTGYDQPEKNGLDANDQRIAGLIYQSLMSYAYQTTNANNLNWTKPSSVVAENILKGSSPAKIAASGSSYTRELFIRGTQPTTVASSTKHSSSKTSLESKIASSGLTSTDSSSSSANSSVSSSASSASEAASSASQASEASSSQTQQQSDSNAANTTTSSETTTQGNTTTTTTTTTTSGGSH